IALARAVAADAPVLVLHDPTTAVDAVTEQSIAEALVAARRRTDRATLLVTRAPALLREADRVVCMRGGEVLCEGTHGELMGLEEYWEVVRRCAGSTGSVPSRMCWGTTPPPAGSSPSTRSCCPSPMPARRCASSSPVCGNTGSRPWRPWWSRSAGPWPRRSCRV